MIYNLMENLKVKIIKVLENFGNIGYQLDFLKLILFLNACENFKFHSVMS